MNRRHWILQTLGLSALGTVAAQDAPALLVQGIDHIQIEPADPAAMMAALQREFAWPALWPYADYGRFSSGGLVLGNVVLEVGRLGRPAGSPTGLTGLALKPAMPSARLAAELDRRGIGHGAPAPFSANPGAPASWTITRVDGFAPPRVFFCEYHIDTAAGLAAARAALARQEGGALGLRGVREVAVAGGAGASAQGWASLLAPTSQQAGGLHALPEGPAVRVLRESGTGIRWLLLEVSSAAQAAKALRDRGFRADAADPTLLAGEGDFAGLVLRLSTAG